MDDDCVGLGCLESEQGDDGNHDGQAGRCHAPA